MNALVRDRVWLLNSAVLCGLGLLFCAAAVSPVSNQLAITSISVQGTNLVLSATVPPGLEEVTLQTRSALDAPWELSGDWSVAKSGGEMTFVLPQSGEVARFFRLRATPLLEISHLSPNETSNSKPAAILREVPHQAPFVVSSELEFVTTASLSSRLTNGNAVFHFKGRVDGSDKILITHEGAMWDHLNWDWPPEPVVVNGTKWNPTVKNYLTTIGPVKFLPESFSLESADLEVIQGRDVVALERTNNGLIVFLDDTPVGPGEYEFKINFHAAGPKHSAASLSAVAHLNIAARIDGSDCIKITVREAILEHKNFDPPSDVSVNGIPWEVGEQMVLKNEGPTRFLPDGVDFSTARIVSRKGRDLATAWAEKDALWVRFADNPNDSDSYEIEISFGPEHE